MAFLREKFDGVLSCTIEEVSHAIKASDFPLPVKADLLCELAEGLSTRMNILFIRRTSSPEKSWILLDMKTLLSEINGRIFAPNNAPNDFPNALHASATGVVPWSQLHKCFDGVLDPELVIAFLGHFEECKVVEDPELISLITSKEYEKLSWEENGIPKLIGSGSIESESDDTELDSPRSPPGPVDKDGLQNYPPHSKDSRSRSASHPIQTHRIPYAHSTSVPVGGCCSRFVVTHHKETPPSSNKDTEPSRHSARKKFLFIPGLISSDKPRTDVWTGDSGFSYYSGWCLQCTQNKFFSLAFSHAVLLRLMFGFAVTRHSCCLSSKECTPWKNGLRWLNLEGIETIVEFIEDRQAIVLLMRVRERSEMKCVRLRSAVIRKILEAKQEYCPKLRTSEYLIDPSHLKENIGYPVIRERLSTLTRFDISLVARAFLNRGKHSSHTSYYIMLCCQYYVNIQRNCLFCLDPSMMALIL